MRIIILLFLIGCGDNYSACEDGVTVYLGPIVNCSGVPENVCVEDRGPGGPPMCRQLCRSPNDGPACGTLDGNPSQIPMFAKTIVVSNEDGSLSNICYCEPHPLLPEQERED